MRKTGLEPAWVAPHAPQSGVLVWRGCGDHFFDLTNLSCGAKSGDNDPNPANGVAILAGEFHVFS
jgi:hypothetical protein